MAKLVLFWYQYNHKKMKITRQEDYALALAAALSKTEAKTFVPLSAIAGALNLPGPFLKRIALTLKKAGVIAVKEGRGGGYRLTRPAKQISLAEIVGPFNPQPGLTACVSKKGFCAKYALCQTRRTWQYISQKFRDDLKKISLAEMLKNPKA
jgi:Rrf2 family protein